MPDGFSSSTALLLVPQLRVAERVESHSSAEILVTDIVADPCKYDVKTRQTDAENLRALPKPARTKVSHEHAGKRNKPHVLYPRLP